jgi:SAM-dependent methyltransferase
VPPDADPAASLLPISDYFDGVYGADDRYWWRNGEPYATDPAMFPSSLLTQLTLLAVRNRVPGSALDIGAGEGADSIRLARLGYKVTAVEISPIGGEKIQRFAAEAGVDVTVEVADIGRYQISDEFDIIICNGVLHYVANKRSVIRNMQAATRPGGLNVVSLWSTHTRVPKCHKVVKVYCDKEDGVVSRAYQNWDPKFIYFDRRKKETAHNEMPAHSHSHIKLIAEKPL